MVTDGEQTKNESTIPLASAAQRVKDKDVEIIAISTRTEDEIDLVDLRNIASGDDDENVFFVTPSQSSPVIITKVTSKVKKVVRGKKAHTLTHLIDLSVALTLKLFHVLLKDVRLSLVLAEQCFIAMSQIC